MVWGLWRTQETVSINISCHSIVAFEYTNLCVLKIHSEMLSSFVRCRNFVTQSGSWLHIMSLYMLSTSWWHDIENDLWFKVYKKILFNVSSLWSSGIPCIVDTKITESRTIHKIIIKLIVIMSGFPEKIRRPSTPALSRPEVPITKTEFNEDVARIERDWALKVMNELEALGDAIVLLQKAAREHDHGRNLPEDMTTAYVRFENCLTALDVRCQRPKNRQEDGWFWKGSFPYEGDYPPQTESEREYLWRSRLFHDRQTRSRGTQSRADSDNKSWKTGLGDWFGLLLKTTYPKLFICALTTRCLQLL